MRLSRIQCCFLRHDEDTSENAHFFAPCNETQETGQLFNANYFFKFYN